MVSRLLRRFGGISTPVVKCRTMNSMARILGVVGVLGIVTVASLNAQDKPQPNDATRRAVPTSPQSAPQAPSSQAEPAAQQTPPRAIQAVEPATLNTVVLANSAPRRFQFTIAPTTPLKDLLPVSPTTKVPGVPMIAKDLTQVPEIEFQMPLEKKLPNEEALKQTAHTMAKINHLNDKKTDAFLEALRRERHDLAGMPFAMGDACRTKGDRSKQFAIEVALVRAALQPNVTALSFTTATPEGVVGSGVRLAPPAMSSGASVPVAPTPAPAVPAGNQPPPTPQPAPALNVGTSPVTPPPIQASPPVAFDPTVAGQTIERVITQGLVVERVERNVTATIVPERFWENYRTCCNNADKEFSGADKCHQDLVTITRIAALMQVLAPESSGIRLGLVNYLASISHAEATPALAKLAIFSTEDAIRQRAIDVLKVRRERDYTDILLGGLRYPWPDVARHAADALIKLERTDLVPQLVDLLDDPDPRAPVVRQENNKRVQEVRELVRVNHHRNCLLCHAPANTGNVASDTLTAAVPIPQDPLPSPSQGYQNSLPDILVRTDVTYLRQDFSMFQAVADANPWPEMQRFDFLVRTRTMTDKEAEAYREKLTIKEPGVQSPYHRAALAALRELTGRDTAPSSDAWRQLLNLPAKPVRTALAR